MRKLLGLFLATLLALPNAYATQLSTFDVFEGVNREINGAKINDGAHRRFDNVYIDGTNIKVIKGRDRLNSTANADTTSNGLCYYENQAGTTKKLIQKESDEIVSYAIDWTGRTSLANTLTDEPIDCEQIGDRLYITSSTDGIYTWDGSSTASALGAVSTPSSVNFSATTGTGGMTTGEPIALTLNVTLDTQCNTICDGTNTVDNSCIRMSINDVAGDGVTSDDGVLEQAETTVTYNYKITSHSSLWGIHSEASSADEAVLSGDDTFTWAATGCTPCDAIHTDATCDDICCSGVDYTTTGGETRVSGTLAAAPSAPYNEYCVWRSTAGGDDYFKVGCQDTGAFTDGKPDNALGDPLDTTIDTISPPSFRYVESYLGTLFVAEGNDIRFTRLPVQAVSGADTYWLETDLLTTGHKKAITGIKKTKRNLLVFMEDKIQEISNFGKSFTIGELIQGLGAVSDETIVTDSNGDVIFFSGTRGVYKVRVSETRPDETVSALDSDGDSRLVRLSSPSLDVVFEGNDTEIDLDPADYSSSHAYYDIDNDLYVLYVGSHNFIFNNQNNTWSHVPGAKFSASVYRKSPNEDGQGVLLDDLGYAWNNWTGYENGVESGTVTGNPTSSTSTTLTDSGASFNTTGDGLAGVWVIKDSSDSSAHTHDDFEYRRIASNTGTVLTVDTAWTNNPTTSDTYYIGYVVPDILTKEYNPGKAPKELESTSFTVVHEKSASNQNVAVSVYSDKSTTASFTSSDDFLDSYADKYGISDRGLFLQWGIRSFVYSTSNTIVPPIDIISYSLRGTIHEED